MTGRYRRTAVIALALILGFAVVADTSTHAASTQPQESITLSPVSRDYKIDAGKELSDELTIVNDGQTPYEFIVYSRPYSVEGEDYKSDYTNVKPNADAYQWVRFPKTRYKIEPKQTLKVPYTITAPVQAAPGGHYGVIFAEIQPTDTGAGAAIVRKKRVGMIVYANVNGQYITKGQLLDTSIPFWQVQPPLSAETRVQNTGNSDFKNAIRYTVRDIFGNVKYDIKKEYAVLPQTTRKISIGWDRAPWFGFFKVELTQKILDQEKTDSGYVLIMPRFLPFIALLLLIAGGGYAIYRRKKK